MSQIPEMMGGRELNHDIPLAEGMNITYPNSTGDVALTRQLSVNTAASAVDVPAVSHPEALYDLTYTIPANSLAAGMRVRIGFQGVVVDNNGTDTLSVILRLGGLAGTALVTIVGANVADADFFSGEIVLHIRTAGASGTFVGHGYVSGFTSISTAMVQVAVASTAINTTVAQVVGVGADWSAVSADNESRLEMLTVEVLG